MYVIILAALLLLFVYQIVRKIISRKKSKHFDSDVSFYGITEADEKYSNNSKPRRNSIFVAFAFTWVFWLLGIGLLYKSYNLIVNEKEITKQGNVTNAVVTDVHEYEVSGAEGETKQERDVYLTFTANGQKYDCVIKKAKIYTSVGEQIEIYYDSDDPTVFVSPEDIHNKTHFCMGVILCAIAVYVHIIFFNESKKKALRKIFCKNANCDKKHILSEQLSGCSVFLQYSLDTVICQDSMHIILMEWSEAE